jgi:hypothetical protein
MPALCSIVIVRLFTIAILTNILFLSSAALSQAEGRLLPLECTYEMQIWNVNLRGSAVTKKIRHSYRDLTPAEVDAVTGCTVCSEDQEIIKLLPLPAFSICSKIASQVRTLIGDLVNRGAVIRTVVGYHVIKSRGPIDGNGDRTGFSNHSYGTAIDINPGQNGLYDNCVAFGPQCRLLRGGEWHPGTPGALTRDDDIVQSLKGAGFRWGGEIEGRQKDFMHFSLTGY